MNCNKEKFHTVDAIMMARKVANHASTLGVTSGVGGRRPNVQHLGAIMADAILQAGVRYHTVVYPRVSMILEKYPEAETLDGVKIIVHNDGLSEFLRWNHATKIQRFLDLLIYFDLNRIETSHDLRSSYCNIGFQSGLLEVSGIGPKTVDYLGCLAGADVIVVDRHMRAFANEIGLKIVDYDGLRTVFSYAADFLGLARRDFDSWVWKIMSSRRRMSNQLSFSTLG
jgi:hypothetical protein